MSSQGKRLRRVLEQELPQVEFIDEAVISHMAAPLDDGEPTEQQVLEAWSPFIISWGCASDEDDALEVCRTVLRRLRSTDGSTTAGSDATAAVESSDAAAGARAARQAPTAPEEVQGLMEWLEELRLTAYSDKALAWCSQMGAAHVDEVIDNWEDFSKELGLKVLERKRVSKAYDKRQEKRAPKAPGGDGKAPKPSDADSSRRNSPAVSSSAPPEKVIETCGDKENPYKLIQEIGSGVTATVYKAIRREGEVDREYAVKAIGLAKLKLHVDYQRISEKLHRETAILFSLRHKNIVSLYDVVETPDKLYLVMELVEGGDLFEYIAKNGGLPESEARYAFLQLIDALMYIHSKGIVHRDLKPENILVDRKETRDGLLNVKISDFGHSKLYADGYSVPLTRVGTPQYWAPEVSDASKCARGYDNRVDLWSLGVVLYVMLEGTYPFDTEDKIRKAAVEFKVPDHPSKGAREVILNLLKVRPLDRLTLEKCRTDPWVTGTGALGRVIKATGHAVGEDWEQCIALPSDPADARELRRDLQVYTTKMKVGATLRKKGSRHEVVVSWQTASSDDSEAAGQELSKLLRHHFPGHTFNVDGRRDTRSTWAPAPDMGVGGRLEPVREVPERTPKTGGSFRLLKVTLRVQEGVGAGVELQEERSGMRVLSIEPNPGQPGLQKNDLIVKIEEVSLGPADEQTVHNNFKKRFRDGAELTIKRQSA